MAVYAISRLRSVVRGLVFFVAPVLIYAGHFLFRFVVSCVSPASPFGHLGLSPLSLSLGFRALSGRTCTLFTLNKHTITHAHRRRWRAIRERRRVCGSRIASLPKKQPSIYPALDFPVSLVFIFGSVSLSVFFSLSLLSRSACSSVRFLAFLSAFMLSTYDHDFCSFFGSSA